MASVSQIVNAKHFRDGFNSAGLPSRDNGKPVIGTVLEDIAFLNACKSAGVEPTKRQASKFRNGHGAAFAARNSF